MLNPLAHSLGSGRPSIPGTSHTEETLRKTQETWRHHVSCSLGCVGSPPNDVAQVARESKPSGSLLFDCWLTVKEH